MFSRKHLPRIDRPGKNRKAKKRLPGRSRQHPEEKVISHGNERETKHFTRKICLLGDPSVGKTSLIDSACNGIHGRSLKAIGVNITRMKNHVEIPETAEDIEMDLLVWDIADQDAPGNVRQSYYRGAAGGLVVADITRRETFDHIVRWISEFLGIAGNVPVLVLVNKYDLRDRASIDEREIDDIVGRLGASYLYTSERTGLNVKKAFGRLCKFLAKRLVPSLTPSI